MRYLYIYSKGSKEKIKVNVKVKVEVDFYYLCCNNRIIKNANYEKDFIYYFDCWFMIMTAH